MVVLHKPVILAIYASSAVTTALNLGLIFHQRRRIRNIYLAMAGIHAQMDGIERRITALEEKRNYKAAA